jgi:HTH-type transcriptional regulator/antitoxin MqsA
MLETEICSFCGGPASLVNEMRSKRMGDRPVTFMDSFYRCAECGEEYFIGEMMDDSQRRATAIIRAEDGLLAPDEIVGLRKKYGFTQAQLERLIGAGAKTVVRWEKGTVAQNKTADTLLRVLRDHPDVVKQLAKENGPPQKAKRPKPTRPRKKAGPTEPAVASD